MEPFVPGLSNSFVLLLNLPLPSRDTNQRVFVEEKHPKATELALANMRFRVSSQHSDTCTDGNLTK